MFPDELPKRLIKMFTFVNDTVLDPFLGSGTTTKAALSLNRNSIAYEINKNFLPVIKKKVGVEGTLVPLTNKIEIIKRNELAEPKEDLEYVPSIQDAKPVISPEKFKFGIRKSLCDFSGTVRTEIKKDNSVPIPCSSDRFVLGICYHNGTNKLICFIS